MAHGISVPSGGRAISRGPKRLLALRGDEHLVERLRRGDETAFEVIYERHVHGLLSFCRHMLGSREEAEDAVQQAFTAAHRDLLRDDREIRLKAWLYTIARNRCLSMLRARREQPEERIEASTEGLADQVEQRADLRELLADLHDLPEDQRAALVLSEMRDLSHAEVAEVLGCRVANVKGLVFRARSGLSERREAREAACESIRQELATAQGGTLRRGRLRHHLRACTGCSGYLEEVRRQRQMIAMILPVAPSLGLKSGVLAAVGIGGGAAGGGGAAAGGGLLAALLPGSGATVAKVAVVGALVAGGGGVAGQVALDLDGSPPDARPAMAPQSASGQPANSPFDVAELPKAARPEGTGSPRETADDARQAKKKGKGKESGKAKKRGKGTKSPFGARPDRGTAGRGPKVRAEKPVRNLAPRGVPKLDRTPRRPDVQAAPPTEPRLKKNAPKKNGGAVGKKTPPAPIAPDG